MPDHELLTVQRVSLATPVRTLISRAGVRVNCALCGEEIINERERTQSDQTICQACAGPAYYVPVSNSLQRVVHSNLQITPAAYL